MALDYAILFGTVLVLLVSYYYYFKWNCRNYWRKRGIPHLESSVIPVLGNIWPTLLMRESFITMMDRFYNLSRDHSMVGFHSLSTPAILIRHPDLIKTVMVTKFSNFKENNVKVDPVLDPLLMGNPFFTSGDVWKTVRAQLSNAFSSAKLKAMFSNAQYICDKLTNYLNEKVRKCPGQVCEVELKDLFTKFTTENIVHVIFGIEGNSFDEQKEGIFMQMEKNIFSPSVRRGLALMATFFVPMINKILRMNVIPYEVDRFFRHIVRDVTRDRKERNVRRNDFLNLMLTIRETKDVDVSPERQNEIMDEVTSRVMAFFIEGSETSSITLSFLGYDVATNPDVQWKLREEVTSVLKEHGGFTYEALQKMTYMDRVIEESMRLHPVFGSLTKVCTNSCDLEGPDGLSCRVDPGTIIFVPTYGLNTNSDYWANPMKFDPDRFSDEAKKTRSKFVHITFGEGPRVCIGIRMALLQLKIALACLLSHFSLEPSPRTQESLEMDPYTLLSYVKGGLWVNVKPLKDSPSLA